MIMAVARKRNAAAGDTAVHKIPATALAARFGPACTVASSPNAEPRRLTGARAARIGWLVRARAAVVWRMA